MDQLFTELAKHPVFSGGVALMAIGAAAAWLRRIPGMGLSALRRRLIYTVEVHDRDQCFAWFQAWLAARDEAKRARDLVVKAHWGSLAPSHGSAPPPSYPGQGTYSESDAARLLLTPAPGTQFTRYRGRPLAVTRSRREITSNGTPTGSHAESITLRFFGAGRDTIDALLAEVLEFSRERPDGVQAYAPDGGWRPVIVLPRRVPESLSLADGLLAEVIADIRAFLGSAAWYAERGIPYRRGYLLHGPPGTGKTTLAPVAAGELGLSVATLSLGDPSLSDAALTSLFRDLPRKTILVIEDIDCVFREREAAGDRIGVTLSGLLNVLDGIGSREGRILFLTTNHPERLDPALIRPGRIDRKIELGYATPDQARRMFLWFFRGFPLGDAYIARLADAFAGRLAAGTTPAAIQEHLLRHREDPAEAARAFGDAPRKIPPAIDARLNGHAPRPVSA